jgi:hypothetical protein
MGTPTTVLPSIETVVNPRWAPESYRGELPPDRYRSQPVAESMARVPDDYYSPPTGRPYPSASFPLQPTHMHSNPFAAREQPRFPPLESAPQERHW